MKTIRIRAYFRIKEYKLNLLINKVFKIRRIPKRERLILISKEKSRAISSFKELTMSSKGLQALRKENDLNRLLLNDKIKIYDLSEFIHTKLPKKKFRDIDNIYSMILKSPDWVDRYLSECLSINDANDIINKTTIVIKNYLENIGISDSERIILCKTINNLQEFKNTETSHVGSIHKNRKTHSEKDYTVFNSIKINNDLKEIINHNMSNYISDDHIEKLITTIQNPFNTNSSKIQWKGIIKDYVTFLYFIIKLNYPKALNRSNKGIGQKGIIEGISAHFIDNDNESIDVKSISSQLSALKKNVQKRSIEIEQIFSIKFNIDTLYNNEDNTHI